MAALRCLCLLLPIVAMGSQSKVGIGQTGPESALVAGDLDPVDRTCEEGVQCKRQSECKSFNEALEEYKEMPTGTCKKKAKFAELKHSVCNKGEQGVCCRDSYSCLQNLFVRCQKDEFSCEDGITCIPWEQLCDGFENCPPHENGDGGEDEVNILNEYYSF